MNREEFKLPLVTVKKFEVKPILEIIFNTLLFNRMIHKQLNVYDVCCDIFKIGYVKMYDSDIQDKIYDAIKNIYESLFEHKTSMVEFSFYVKMEKNGFLTKYKEKFIWEKWYIPIRYSNKPDIEYSKIQPYFEQILTKLTWKTNHLYSIVSHMNCSYFFIEWSDKPKKRRSSWKRVVDGIKKFSPPEFGII